MTNWLFTFLVVMITPTQVIFQVFAYGVSELTFVILYSATELIGYKSVRNPLLAHNLRVLTGLSPCRFYIVWACTNAAFVLIIYVFCELSICFRSARSNKHLTPAFPRSR